MTAGRPLTVALVADEDPGWGGIGTYTGVMAGGLRDLGHRVHVVLRGWEQDGSEERDGLMVHRLTVGEPSWRRGTEAVVSRLYVARESLIFSARVARLLARLARQEGLEVVEAPEFHAPGLAAALRRRAVHRSPVVVTRLHTPSYLAARLGGETPDPDLRALELLECASAHAATRVTSPSAALAAEVARRWRLATQRVEVVGNPVETDVFAPAEGPVDEDSLVVVGRIERGKGQDVLLDALPAIRRTAPRARLRLVGADGGGPGAGSFTESLRRRASGLGLEAAAVDAPGAVDRARLPATYRAAAVCVVPSRFESFSYACLEAMACGRPVIASRVGGLAELIEHGHDGLLVEPEDPAALAEAVGELLGDASRRRQLGERARETVVRRYAVPVIAARTASLYERLLMRRP